MNLSPLRYRWVPTVVVLVAMTLALPLVAEAKVKPSNLFTSGAVLQRDVKVPVWGTADEGEKVTVKIADQEASTTAKGGKWRVDLKPMKAGGPHTLTIQGADSTVKVENVLVGEVWIASGQSNMQWSVLQSSDPEETVSNSANPQIRLFTVPRRPTVEPQSEVDSQWVECGPKTVGGFSAVGYAFGRDLQEKLKVPVGIISTNYGGTPAEAWTSQGTLKADPKLAGLLQKPTSDKDPHSPSGLFNAMIHPLLPYAIGGAIWYQGESNAGRAWEYRTLFPAMITDWRKAWGQGDFPFLLVQLAPFQDIVNEPGDSNWAELREAQLLSTQVLPKVAMAVITDLGDEKDIHPKQKKPVGERLSLAAQALAYGKDIEFSGPVYQSQQVEGDKIVLSFTHIGGGLEAKGGPLKGFAICGADHKFVNAEAEIRGDQVVVSSPKVKSPVAVRYGWANYPVVNLANKAGLLASPFRTDDFQVTTQAAAEAGK